MHLNVSNHIFFLIFMLLSNSLQRSIILMTFTGNYEFFFRSVCQTVSQGFALSLSLSFVRLFGCLLYSRSYFCLYFFFGWHKSASCASMHTHTRATRASRLCSLMCVINSASFKSFLRVSECVCVCDHLANQRMMSYVLWHCEMRNCTKKKTHTFGVGPV